jgi:AcrR family transcriptional regulator
MNLDKYKTGRFKPLQTRGKERVRVILSAALTEFKTKGLEDVTTNDIAKAARIPIGSLYRYYPNKDAIINALVDLYADDISQLFSEISQHPYLRGLSWEEVLLLLVESWMDYSRLNGPFHFLHAVRATPRLNEQNMYAWQKLRNSFFEVIVNRCPSLTAKQQQVCFGLTLAAAEMALQEQEVHEKGPLPYQEAIGVVARYMLNICGHEHPVIA